MLDSVKMWAGIIGVALLAGFVGLFIWRGHQIDELNKQLNDAKSQVIVLQRNQTITTEADNELHKQSDIINNNYNSAMQLLAEQARKLSAANTASGNNVAAPNNRLYYTDVSAAYAVTKRQKIATDQANQLIQCQNFLTQERKQIPTNP